MNTIQQKRVLKSYFPEYFTEGAIFSKMSQAPWVDAGVALDMDITYLSMWSGRKTPSDSICDFLVDGILDQQKLSEVLWTLYGHNWTRLWEAFQTKYIPIYNYDVQETVSRTQNDDRKIDRNNDYTSTVDGTGKQTGSVESTGTNALEHGLNIQVDGKVESYTHGFNSIAPVPTTVQDETQTTVNTGTDTTKTTDNTVSESDTSTKSVEADKTIETTTDNLDTTENTQRTRQGNMGQMSYQDLLMKEFELWKWNFYKQVFSDCDAFLTLSIYDACI